MTAGADQPLPGMEPAPEVKLSMVLVEDTGVRRCAHSSCQTDATTDEVAAEWVRALQAAAQLRGSDQLDALQRHMRSV